MGNTLLWTALDLEGITVGLFFFFFELKKTEARIGEGLAQGPKLARGGTRKEAATTDSSHRPAADCGQGPKGPAECIRFSNVSVRQGCPQEHGSSHQEWVFSLADFA